MGGMNVVRILKLNKDELRGFGGGGLIISTFCAADVTLIEHIFVSVH